MKEIKLSQHGKNRGKYVALVDDEDFERVSKFEWCVKKGKNTTYATMNVYINSKRTTQTLHQLIMEKTGIDHINGDGLNCQKYNLRQCTNQQNSMNRIGNKNTSSQYKGVIWWDRSKKWVAQIMHNRKHVYIGLFTEEIEAAKAYDLKAKELFGEFAWLNFK
jgi:hypothetical protein